MFKTSRRVEFRDTDAAGIVHFSAFFPMMESAEHEMLRSLGMSVMPRKSLTGDGTDGETTQVTWPRVSASCDYVSAARFEDILEIGVSITKIGRSSVQYRIDFTREGQPIASGQITAVCCTLHEGSLSKVDVPESIRTKLRQHLSDS